MGILDLDLPGVIGMATPLGVLDATLGKIIHPSLEVGDSKVKGELDKKVYDDGSNKVTERSGYGQAGGGSWKGEDGNDNSGLSLEAGAKKWVGEHVGRFFDVGWDLGGGTAGAKAVHSKSPDGKSSTVDIGAGANKVEGSATIQSKDKGTRFASGCPTE